MQVHQVITIDRLGAPLPAVGDAQLARSASRIPARAPVAPRPHSGEASSASSASSTDRTALSAVPSPASARPRRAAHSSRGTRAAVPLRRLQPGGDPADQVSGAERLDQVVIGPGSQPLSGRLDARPGPQHEHRQPRQIRIGADRGDQPEPVHDRHHHVGDQQVVGPGGTARQIERLPAIGGGHHREAGLEHPGQVRAHVGVVVGDQHQRPARRPRLRAARIPRAGRDPLPCLIDVRAARDPRRRPWGWPGRRPCLPCCFVGGSDPGLRKPSP